MHPDLMGAAGFYSALDQCAQARLRQLGVGQPRDPGQSRGAVGLHRDPPLPLAGQIALQRVVQRARAQRPSADDDGPIALVDLPFAEPPLQIDQCRPLPGNQQHARGFAVEPVHQFQRARLRSRRPQLLDNTAGHTAATMHGHAGGLVDDQQVVVLVQDWKLCCRHPRRPGRLPAHRRHTHPVAGHQPVISGTAGTIDPHLAAADQLIDVALGHALQQPGKQIVEPLAAGFLVHVVERHRRLQHPPAERLHRPCRRRFSFCA